MSKTSLKKYEIFHKSTSLQGKIIHEKNFTYRTLLKVINKYLENKLEILDVGCGAGTIDYYLANKNHLVMGIDVSTNAIKVCKENAKVLNLNNNLKFFQRNFPSQTISGMFDLIIFSEVLEHLSLDNKAILMAKKHLSKNGVLVISVPSSNAPLFKLGLIKNFDDRVGHLRRYSGKSLSIVLEKNGFSINEVVKTESILRNMFFVYPFFGFFIKILNNFNLFSDIMSYLDKFLVSIFGESNIIVVAKIK